MVMMALAMKLRKKGLLEDVTGVAVVSCEGRRARVHDRDSLS